MGVRPVKIVSSYHDIKRVQDGDILVANTTHPNYLPAMQKAAAFITNEGGMISHAAIVARELKKPCIVGTGNATKILVEGDFVEVDANKGVVKVLEQVVDKGRPITTLTSTPGNKTNLHNENIDWMHYLTRPFSLFGASLWQTWYDSDEIKELIGVSTPNALFIEEHQDVVRYYREKKQLAAMRGAIERMVRQDPLKLKAIFEKGFKLNERAKKSLELGPEAFQNLDEAVRAIIELALHATVVPNLSLVFIDALKVKDSSIRAMVEKLRGQSYYPRFNSQIVAPHVLRVLKRNGIRELAAPLITLKELRESNFSALEDRIKARQSGKRFIYEVTGNKELVQWIFDPMIIVREIEHIPVLENMGNELKGQVAYRGKVTGVARLVLSDSPEGVHFDEGDILVSINSSPALMPLILKSAAIVTDEGGIACHAAIVSRELKKPCVMATKYATALIKDGDIVEVDAYQGVVKILEQVVDKGRPITTL